MGEISKVIGIAESYVGAKEGDSRYAKLIKAFETSGLKYDGQGCCETACAFFILAFGLKRAKELIPISNYANGQSKMWKDGLSKTPRIGSLMYFGGTDINHVELVIDIKGTKIVTIDGNSNHSVVKRTRYTYNNGIKGYGIPKYNADRSALDDTWLRATIDTVVVKKGSKGEVVLWLQEFLHIEGYYNGYLDKKFGSVLDSAVRAYQKDHGLQADGVCAKYFWSFVLLGVRL